MPKILAKLVPAIAVALSGVGAHAATQTLDGVGFDISYNDQAVGLFGTPTLAGSTLRFAPSAFRAETSFGVTPANSTFSFMITADPGYTLTGFSLLEQGAYALGGVFSGVWVTGTLRVSGGSEVGIVPGSPTDAFGDNPWSASAAIDALALHSATVSIENDLLAYAFGPEDFASIQKSAVALTVGVVGGPANILAVPEPKTYALMLAGLGMIGLAASRRTRRG